MIVFKAGLVLLIIRILLLLIVILIKESNVSVYATRVAVIMMFLGYIIGMTIGNILGMITGAIPVVNIL